MQEKKLAHAADESLRANLTASESCMRVCILTTKLRIACARAHTSDSDGDKRARIAPVFIAILQSAARARVRTDAYEKFLTLIFSHLVCVLFTLPRCAPSLSLRSIIASTNKYLSRQRVAMMSRHRRCKASERATDIDKSNGASQIVRQLVIDYCF